MERKNFGDRPRRSDSSRSNSQSKSGRPSRSSNSSNSSRPSRPSKPGERNERSDRPRSDRPRSDRPRSDRPRSDRPQRDGEFKPRTPRSSSGSGLRNNSAFKPRNERFGDRSLENRRKDDLRPVNRDFSKDPIIPEGITGEELDKVTRGDLLTLSAENAKIVSQHLACVHAFADSDPEIAHEHAQAAVRHAGRVAVVRETAGYAAYRVGKFDIAIKDLKAAFRINGDVSIWPVLADCERGMGRPRKALELAGAPEAKKLAKEQAVELRIVAAGARRDLGEIDAAVVTLQTNDLNTENDSWAIRLRYAYADALADAGRDDESRKWFKKCAELDLDESTDASERC
jgi:tetratricopeptide (TPR) repeat protein